MPRDDYHFWGKMSIELLVIAETIEGVFSFLQSFQGLYIRQLLDIINRINNNTTHKQSDLNKMTSVEFEATEKLTLENNEATKRRQNGRLYCLLSPFYSILVLQFPCAHPVAEEFVSNSQ